MQKEIITREIIKNELKQLLKIRIHSVIMMFAVVLPLTVFLIYLSETAKIYTSFALFFFKIPFVLTLCGGTYCIYDMLKFIFAVKKDKFELTTDRLVDIKEQHYTQRNSTIELQPCGPFWLYFSECRKYHIPIENYRWSKLYNMTDVGICNYSTVGDEFYLVIVGKRNVAFVYNTKLFELED